MVIRTYEHALPSEEMALTARMPNLHYESLRKICSMKETAIARKYGLTYVHSPDGGYYFKDNGADILAVAHLDSVSPYMHFDTARLRPDTLIWASNLDDRLGVYVILDYLPKAGVKCDILLTTNEEKGRSTARYFPGKNKTYKWMFMFDRIGTGATVYNYHGEQWEAALKDVGFSLGSGAYSCIKNLEHLGCCGVNFGVGYHDPHSVYSYASRNELMLQLHQFLGFYEANSQFLYPFKYTPPVAMGYSKRKVEASNIDISNIDNEMKEALKRELKRKKYKDIRFDGDYDISLDEKTIKEVEEFAKKADAERAAITAFLLQPPGLLHIPDELITKLHNLQFCNIGEVIAMSRTELLSILGITALDTYKIEQAIKPFGLTFSTKLSEYGITIINHLPSKGNKKEEPQKPTGKIINLLPVAPKTKLASKEEVKIEDKVIDLQSKNLSSSPAVAAGVIMWTIPLVTSKISRYQKSKKGEFEWVIPSQEVGFKIPERIAA